MANALDMMSNRRHVSRFPWTMGFVCYHAAVSIRPGMVSGRAPRSALPGLLLYLVIQLQSKLNLPRIVRSITRRSDLAEVRAGKVRRIRNRDHTVAAKSRGVEVRMIQDIE